MTTYHLTTKSANAKTGPIPVTTTSANTCPLSCPMRDACYAKSGPLALHWGAVNQGKRGGNLETLCDAVKAFPAGQVWRHNQAGDLPGEGEDIDAGQLAQLTMANRGKRGYTYTHKLPHINGNAAAIAAANKGGFTVNLSANTPAHADTLLALGIGPVVTILPLAHKGKAHKTPAGHRVVVCPAQLDTTGTVNCASCKLCAQAKRAFVIGFIAHGSGAKRADAIASASVSASA